MSVLRLAESISECGSPIALRLDAQLNLVPSCIREAQCFKPDLAQIHMSALMECNRKIIDATHESVAAFVIPSAFYGIYGLLGRRLLTNTIRYAQSYNKFVILDEKTNQSFFGADSIITATAGNHDNVTEMLPNAMTVSPYCGEEHIQPFVFAANKFMKSVFVYINPMEKYGAEGFTQMVMGFVGQAIGASHYSNVGICFDSDNFEAIWEVRRKLTRSFVMAEVEKITPEIKNCFNSDGSGAILTFSAYKLLKNNVQYQKSLVSSVNSIKRSVNKELFRKSRIIQI